ncbi:MAG: DEAD/DEAH box helicase [Methylocella sp.]
MFDAESTALLRASPRFRGLDPERIPQELTSIYAELVSLRLRQTDETASDTWLKRLDRLSRLAAFCEAIVDARPEGIKRRAAAFVAGSAYQLLGRSRPETDDNAPVPLSAAAVHPSLAAPLLFLIADQNPDAREAAKVLRGRRAADRITTALVETVYDLATERFESILERAGRLRELRPATEVSPQSAVQALYGLCWAGTLQMVAQLLGRSTLETEFQVMGTPQETFDYVVTLSTAELRAGPDFRPQVSAYTGPRHLARLLRSVADGLEGSSIAHIPPPAGAGAEYWSAWQHHRSATKPVLWRSHRAAIGTGFLDAGRSAVLVLPTGAGKTTLSELKIAATLAAGRKVVFLVPTLALVEQLRDELAHTFPRDITGVEVSADGDLVARILAPELKAIEVMTPERCLALLSHAPDALLDIGLVVFDECHLLSPAGGGKRSLDAMLCLLHATARAPDADFLLLSAMLTNAPDVAEWIQELTGRPCIAFQDPWKPSRQARGVVVYPKSDLDRLVQQARASQLRRSHQKRISMEVMPYGLFGLQQNWNPEELTDRRIVRLLDAPVSLARSQDGRITPNANNVAATLASYAGKAMLKTIIFVQQADHAVSTARKAAEALAGDLELAPAETELWNAVKSELGGPEFSLVQPHSGALPHNADMLSVERRLVEALFRRSGGASVIVATPTLSQGMNLPAQVVILAGDKRYDIDGRRNLEAHEILNAAGRAGRAGHLANGIVLLIPEPIASFTQNLNPDTVAYDKLRVVLPHTDQCVRIDDPLTGMLDRIQEGDTADPKVQYFMSRLRVGANQENAAQAAEQLVHRSFSFYQARKSHKEEAVGAQIESLRAAIAQNPQNDAKLDLIVQSSGLPSEVMISVARKLEDDVVTLPRSISDWSDWIVRFLEEQRVELSSLFGEDAGTFLYVMRGKKSGDAPIAEEYERLRAGMKAWLTGMPFCDIESALKGAAEVLGYCPRARDLVLKLASRTLYLFAAAIADLARLIAERHGVLVQPAVLDALPVGIRKGLDSPDKVAFTSLVPGLLTRVRVHREFAAMIGESMQLQAETYEEVRNRVDALLLFGGFARQ